MEGLTEVKGFGRQKGHTELYVVDFPPKSTIEMLLDDVEAAQAGEVLTEAARTGQIGDGKIFVLPVDEAIRIRTGERGRDAV